MYFLYSLLLTLGLLVLLPRFLFDAIRHGKYVAGFRERLGTVAAIESNGRPIIWLHCVSVGESQAARSLVQAIRKRFPEYLVVISTITLAGQNLARELFKDEAARVFYFPFDWRWTVRRALRAIDPATVLIMETELWPGFLRECQARQTPVAIVNGRLSQQSFRRYHVIKGFLSRVLQGLSLAVMQTAADADRIRRLGLNSSKVFVAGSLKFDAGTIAAPNSLASAFRQRFNLRTETQLILAASTHAPEERIILEAFQRMRADSVLASRLLLAPRHPERFAEVRSLLKKSGLIWSSRSAPASPADATCDVILLDTIGELPAIYSLASIVFVGGSITNRGGHNILEPAAVGAAIVTGPHTHNFDVIVKAFVKGGAIVQLPRLSSEEARLELARVFGQLLVDDQRRQELGQKAKHLVTQNMGATERTLEILNSILAISPAASQRHGSARAGGLDRK